MAKQVATVGNAGAEVVHRQFDEPRMTPWLAAAVSAIADPHPDTGARIEQGAPHVLTEALVVLAGYEPLCRPAGGDVVRRFLLPLLAIVRFPPSPGRDFEDKAAGLCQSARKRDPGSASKRDPHGSGLCR